MAVVLCAVLAERPGKERFPVEKFDVAVAGIDGVHPGAHDDFAPPPAVFVRDEIAHGHHKNGDVRSLFAVSAEEGFVPFREKFRGRRIVVEFHDECGDIEFSNGVGDAEFASARSAESHIDEMKIKHSREDDGIDHSGASGGAAVGDGGTVEDDGFCDAVRDGRFDDASRNGPDCDCGGCAVIGKPKRAVGEFSVGGEFPESFEAVVADGDDAVAAEFAFGSGSGIKIESVASSPVVSVPDFIESRAHADDGGVRAEPDRFTRALHAHGEDSFLVAHSGDVQRQTASASFAVDIRESFEGERRGESVAEFEFLIADGARFEIGVELGEIFLVHLKYSVV